MIATGVPAGLGEPVFDRLDADIAYAMMGINAVKAVEIGAGTRCVEQRGSEHRDELTPDGFASNNAGGILGGISSGQDIVVHVSFKPTSSIQMPGRTVDVVGNPVEVVTTGRHDPCVGLRATPIAEAMLAIVLMDHYLRHRAQNADVHPLRNRPKSMSSYNVAVVGATGLVGETMIKVLEERKFPVGQLFALASNRSIGKTVQFKGRAVARAGPRHVRFQPGADRAFLRRRLPFRASLRRRLPRPAASSSTTPASSATTTRSRWSCRR